LPIEACEAIVALHEVTMAMGGVIAASAHRELVDRCWALGVRAWDLRLARMEGAVDDSSARDVSCLSQAEWRVAEAVGSGLTNREAATRLYLAVKTVDFHLQQIYRKLDLRSRTELAVVMSTQRADVRRSRAS
jgi:DNA-binding NarL/FixJ family response regulator